MLKKVCDLILRLFFLVAIVCRAYCDDFAGKTIRVGFFHLPGYYEQSSTGERSGYGFAYLQHLGARLGCNYEYLGYGKELAELLEMLRRGEIDFMICATKDPALELSYDFSVGAVGVSSTMITVKSGNTNFVSGTYENWDGIRVGMISASRRNAHFAEFARKKGFSFEPVYFSSYDKLMTALHTGVVDALVSSNLRKTVDEWIVGNFSPAPVSIIVKKGNTNLLVEVDRAIAALDRDEPMLSSELLVDNNMYGENASLQFTSEELHFIDAAQKTGRVFKALLNPDCYPFSFYENGKITGVISQICELMRIRSGLNIEIVQHRTRSDYANAIASGDFDIILDASHDFMQAERDNIHISDSYLSARYARIQLKSHRGTIKTVAVPCGKHTDDYAKLVSSILPETEAVVCESTEAVVTAVKSGAVDAGYLLAGTANKIVLYDADNTLLTQLRFGHQFNYSVGTKRGLSKEFFSVIGKSLCSVSKEEIAALVDVYELKSVQNGFAPRAWFREHMFQVAASSAGILFIILFLMTGFILSRRRIWSEAEKLKKSKEQIGELALKLQLALKNWELASDFVGLQPYRMDIRTREVFGDVDRIAKYWEVRDGKAISPDEWLVIDDQERTSSVYQAYCRGEIDSFTFTYRIRREDGRLCYMRQYGYRDKTDKNILCGLIQDITSITEAEMERSSVMAFWEKIINEIPIMLFVKDANDDFRYIQCNRNFAEFIGFTHGYIIGKTDDELYRNVKESEVFNNWDRKVINGGQAVNIYETATGADGATHHFHTVKLPFKDAGGQTLLIGMALDISTEIKQREAMQENAELWKTVMDELPVMFFVTDAKDKFRYIMCNKANADFIGTTPDKIIGKTLSELKSSIIDFEREERIERTIAKDGTLQRTREDFTTKSGVVRIIEKIALPFLGKNGRKLVVSLAFDITEREQNLRLAMLSEKILAGLMTESDLEKSLEFIGHTVIEICQCRNVVMMKCDTDGKLRFMKELTSAATEKLSKDRTNVYEAAWNQYIGRLSANEIIHFTRLDDEPNMAKLCDVLTECRGKAFAAVPVISGGKLFGAIILSYPVLRLFTDIDNLMFRTIANCFCLADERDRQNSKLQESRMAQTRQLAERTALNEYLLAANKRLDVAVKTAQAAERAKSFFLATMSHEIRTPLNAVIGFSELLKDISLPASVRSEYLNDISIAGNALLALINDILDLSKLEAGQMVFSPVETDFSALVREMQIIFQSKLIEKKLNFRIEVQDMPTLLIDKLRMRQILFNLIGNAVKFTDKGSIAVTGCYKDDSENQGVLHFAVNDTGHGIAPDDQDSIFEPFVQSESLRGTKVANSGTGLGLPIVRRMLQCINGTISVKSALGKGSSFIVEVRNVKAVRSTKTPQDAASVIKAITPANIHDSVLLVDDVALNLKVMKAICLKCGVKHVETAISGDDALKILKNGHFDFVLTDMWMPKMSGMDLVKHIRADKNMRDVPVYVVTADAEAASNPEFSCFTGLVLKPVTIERIRAILGKKTSSCRS